jgi:hypothetical protein
MALEYYSGPYIQFAILLVFPVTLATVLHGLTMGLVLAVCLPLLRLSFYLGWSVPLPWSLAAVDAVTDVVILAGTAFLIDRVSRQEQELRVLEGLLPICSFCKRIRDEGGHWRQMETYIADRSAARFSHTFCPECGRRHYPELVE